MKEEMDQSSDEMFDKALEIAEKHLERAMQDGGNLAPYVAVAMIEAAVNAAVEETSHEDVVDMLRDLANQIEEDAEDADDDED